jgi:primosomal protein N'
MDTQQSLFDGIVPWATDAPFVVVVQRLGPTGPTLRVRIPRSWCDSIAMGACLEVPVGRHSEYVYIVSLQDTDPPHPGAGSPISIPDAVRRVEGAALPPTVMRLAEWGARYYACPLGGFLAGVLPSAIREESQPAAHRRLVLAAGWDHLPLRRRQKTVMALLALDPDLTTGAGLTPAEIARRVRTTQATLDGLVAAGALSDQLDVPLVREVVKGTAASACHPPPTRSSRPSVRISSAPASRTC